MEQPTILANNGERQRALSPATCSASRSYWLYVWRESKYRPGIPNDSSEQPQIFKAICGEEAAEIAAERAADAILWELYDGSGWSDKSNLIATKKRGLVTPPVVCISALFGATDRKIIIAEIDAAAAAMDACYKELSPVAKASAVKLAHALASLRQKMEAPNAPGERLPTQTL